MQKWPILSSMSCHPPLPRAVSIYCQSAGGLGGYTQDHLTTPQQCNGGQGTVRMQELIQLQLCRCWERIGKGAG